MTTEPEIIEQSRRHVARNIRILMQQQDVGVEHLTVILDLPKNTVGRKINGQTNFTVGEIKKVIRFLNTSQKQLLSDDLVDKPAPKYKKTGEEMTLEQIDISDLLSFVDAGDTEVVKTVGEALDLVLETAHSTAQPRSLERKASTLVRLIQTTDSTTLPFWTLLEKIYMASLTGQIGSLEYYLRHNLLAKVMHFKSDLPTEEEKRAYVEHYTEQYEKWKAALVPDIQEVTKIAILSNSFDDVVAALTSELPAELAEYVTDTITNCTKLQKVDMDAAATKLEASIARLGKCMDILMEYINKK